MARKPRLSDLMENKAAAQEPDESPQIEPPAKPDNTSAPKGKKLKGVLVRMRIEGWRELKDLAADLTIETGERHTLQSLLVDAANRVLKEHQRPPVA